MKLFLDDDSTNLYLTVKDIDSLIKNLKTLKDCSCDDHFHILDKDSWDKLDFVLDEGEDSNCDMTLVNSNKKEK